MLDVCVCVCVVCVYVYVCVCALEDVSYSTAHTCSMRAWGGAVDGQVPD